MKNNCEGTPLKCFFKLLKWMLYIFIITMFFSTAIILYTRYPMVYSRIIKLWPIGVLIFSVVLQYFYFETKFSPFLLLAGFLFIIGLMFNINLHINFYTPSKELPIIFMAMAGALLNYYLFKGRNIFLVPFILILIIANILLLLAPLYTPFIRSSSLYLYLIILVVVFTFSLLKGKSK